MKKKNLLLGIAMVGSLLVACNKGGESVSVEDSTTSVDVVSPISESPSVTSVEPSATSVEESQVASDSEVASEEVTSVAPVSTSTEESITPNVFIVSVSTKASFATFAENKTEKDNKQIEFSDLTKNYVVGDDNGVKVKPVVEFENVMGLPVKVDEWNYLVDVYIKNGEDFVLLGENDLTTYVDSIDYVNCEVNFSSSAVGKTFKIVVTPEGLSAKQQNNIAKYQAAMEFDVVDGFNLYNAKELAYYNNVYVGGSDWASDSAIWNEFKTQNDLDTTYSPSAIILHDNISVKTEDVPSKFFYNAGDEDLKESASDYARTLGSLRDWSDIYTHLYAKDEKVSFYGNYFTLSFAEFPYVTRKSTGYTEVGEVISHSTLFRNEALPEALADDATASFTMSDVNLIGNAPKQENTVLGGGLIMNKDDNMKTSMSNILSRRWFITYFPESRHALYTIDNCKAYDNFNSFIYNWGATVNVSNSEMIGAGGPIIIQDHVNNKNADGGEIGRSTFKNCNLQSYVAGTEGWFELVGASGVAPQIKTLNAAFTNFGANYVFKNNDVDMFNLISVNKSGSAESITPGEVIKGSVQFDELPAFDFGETNPYLAGFISQVTSVSPEAPIYQSTGSATAFAYFNGSCLVDAARTSLNTAEAATNPIFQGDYLGLYYMGMCFTFGYYHPTPAL